MDIFLVRHGEASATWGQSADPGLSELGRQQAATAAQALLPLLPDSVTLISSPLARAQETAAPLASALGCDVVIEPVFREIPSPVPLAERQDWLRQFMQQRWQEQGEDLHHWRQAAVDYLHAMPGAAVIFTHFLVINTVAGYALGRDETCHFYPDNGSVTHLRRNGVGTQSVLEVSRLGAELGSFVN